MGSRMTPKERIIRTLEKSDVDHLPTQIDLAPAMIDKLADTHNLPRNEEKMLGYLNNHIVYAYLNDVFGNIRKRKYSTKDKIVHDSWGVGWNTSADGACFCHYPLEDLNNWKNYKFPDHNEMGLMDLASKTLSIYNKDYFVCSYQNILLFERAWTLRGMQNFMEDLMINLDFAETLLDIIADYQVEIAKRYVLLGVHCGRTGDDYGMQRGMMISPNLWRDLIKPRLQRIWNVYLEAGLPVMHHCCGDARPILDDFIEMGLSILHPVQPEAMPLVELKREHGANLTFYGGVSTQTTIPFGSVQQIEEEVDRCVKVLGFNGGYILAPSHTLTAEISMTRMHAFINAVQKYLR